MGAGQLVEEICSHTTSLRAHETAVSRLDQRVVQAFARRIAEPNEHPQTKLKVCSSDTRDQTPLVFA